MNFLLILLFLIFSLHAEQPLRLKSIDSEGRRLLLDDGTFWTISWWNSWTSNDWQPQDTIRCEKRDENHFYLENLTKMNGIFAQKIPETRNPYRHTIFSVSQDGNWIQLDNGALWRTNKAYREEVDSSWKEDDEVILSYEPRPFRGEAYYLENLRTFTKVPVHFHMQAGKLKCLKLDTVFWSYILLNDGTKWAFTSSFDCVSRWGWKKGDRVTLCADLEIPTRFLLFNYDANYRDFAAIYVTPAN